jgi:HSP20 family protein
MNFLENRQILKELLQQGDVMNTVNGGVRETHFRMEKSGKDLIVELANPSIRPESFNISVHGNDLMINVLHAAGGRNTEEGRVYPIFARIIKIPYFVDINGIKAYYEDGLFKVLLPYNPALPENPFRIRIENLDD